MRPEGDRMLNFNRGDAKPPEKPPLKPAPFGTAMPQPNPGAMPLRTPSQPLATPRDSAPVPTPQAAVEPPVLTTTAAESAGRAIGQETPGSKLIVGPNIKLKGVEISDCDVLIVEGQLEATVNSKAMQIFFLSSRRRHTIYEQGRIRSTQSGRPTLK